MKNRFVLSSLVLTAGYSGAFAAEAFGVLPSSVSVTSGFPLFVAWFAAAGVLALAFRDYTRVRAYDAQPKPRIEAATSAPSAATADTGWVHRTVSA